VSRFANKQETQESAERRLIEFLQFATDRPSLRASITVDSILRTHNVTEKVAKYRLMLAQQRWAAE